jgi:hypothetical protein
MASTAASSSGIRLGKLYVNYPMTAVRGLQLRGNVPRRLQGGPHAAIPLPDLQREAG